MLVGYARVSTTEQNTNLQFDALVNYGIDKRNIFEDKVSGVKDTRVGLDSAMNFLNNGDTLVVWKLDRLGRSLKHLISIVLELESKGVKFISLTENINTTTAAGQLVFHIFGALAEFERNLIRQRVKSGLESARLRGIKGGRPQAISNEKFNAIKLALENGMPKSVVCKTFNVKRSTLFDRLKQSGDLR